MLGQPLTALRFAFFRPANAASFGDADSRAVRDAILAHHPALPMTLIAEAVAYVLRAE